MKKELVIGLSTILLVATPAFAAPSNGHGNAIDAKDNHGQGIANEKTIDVPPVTLPTNVPVTVPPIQTTSNTVENAADVTDTPTATPTPGKRGKSHEESVLGDQVSPTQTVCDPNAEWKNHGAYVSCVAKMHPGGEVVAAAAKSDIGKKSHESSPSATPTVSPTPPISSSVSVLGFSMKPLDTFFKAIGHLIQGLPFFHQHSH